MSKVVKSAAPLWGFDPARVSLVAARENSVWRAEGEGGSYALRLHRPGYRTDAELLSELQWMEMLAKGGLTVPRPIPSLAGRLVEQIGDTSVDVLGWMPGRMLGEKGGMPGITDRPGLMRQLGALLARLHDLSDAWTPPPGFSRPKWDRAGLLGKTPLWGPFWENPDLTSRQRDTVLAAQAKALAALAALEGGLDYGLIHADAITENIMVDGDRLVLIDFDDGGWGFRDFELATVLMRQLDRPDYPALRTALIDGYAARRRVDARVLDLMLLLRALTYLGWIIPRLSEPGGAERSARAVATALPLAQAYVRGHDG
ncbi:phosphotransferase enzyme family protein [Pararhodobacter zhoushanensis]|uniref:Phosphotransferase n=1 Tax=Pararhodobacter zhoushanensis TaxID=2479545 RepID=A0ABT3H4L5_9RHOB|nr:phosphotransferase [Pararhodobacter zhoushanensis]MCW1934748.1 phosphotransferase [Pararhodobacter zhoushanensis]